MTDDLESPNLHEGDHDPVIAERFRVLERATPPSDALSSVAGVPAASDESLSSGRRSGFLLAVAACVGVLLVGVAALVAVNRDDGSEQTEDAVAAGDGDESQDAEDPDDADGDPAGGNISSDTTAALVVDGADDERTTTRPDPDGDDPDGDDPDGDDPDGDEEADADDSADGTTGDPNDSSNGSDSGASDNPITTIPVDDDQPVSTVAPKTTLVPPPDDNGVDGERDPAIVSLSGTVTEVFTDCQSRLVLDESGQVVDGGPVSCDGGSYIIVNGTRVFTASGFTSADLAYNKHPSNLKPGQRVSVIAAPFGGSDGPLSLACDSCRVRIG